MTDTGKLATDIVAALNARDFAALAAACDEDVTLSGVEGRNQGRDALRDRLARHFQAHDETYGDMVVMADEGGGLVSALVTARGVGAGGTAYSVEMILCFTFDGDRLSRIGFFVDGFDTGGRN